MTVQSFLHRGCTAGCQIVAMSELLRPNSRLQAPKDIDASSVERVLSAYLVSQQSRDATTLLMTLKEAVTWKSAPQPSALAVFVPLFGGFASIARTGVLPAKMMSMAFVTLRKACPSDFTGQDTSHWAADASSLIRATFS